MASSPPPSAPLRRRRTLAAGGGLIVLLALLIAWRGGWLTRNRTPPEPPPPGPPPDPRLTYATSYRNVRPGIAYVGSAACAGCHRAITESFRHHPMGRASVPGTELVGEAIGLLPSGQEPLPGTPVLVSWLSRLERYNSPAHDPFLVHGIEHRVELRGSEVVHRETRRDAAGQVVATLEAPVCLAIGSGTRGRTYAIARGDALFQSPISWYSQAARWDLSPGYEHGHTQFERPVTVGCLYCHTNAVEPVDGSANRYRPPLVRGHAIGCERCHGPGELHVASRKRGETFEGRDPTIVNPGDLEPSLRESVCEQCHLQGLIAIPRPGRHWFEYRPGLPYDLFWSVFVPPEELRDPRKSVRTVEQMHASACYRKSAGALGCISCHDPHELPAPEEKAAFYRGRCLQCHADSPGKARSAPHAVHAPGCNEAMAVRRAKADNCVACHMPPLRSSDIAHTANTDHRVPRRPDVPSAPDAAAAAGQDEFPLVHFHRDRRAPGDPGPSRDLGIALALLSMRPPNKEVAQLALSLLGPALKDWPGDLLAQEARANALTTLGQPQEALSVYEAILNQTPAEENILLRAAGLAERLGRQRDAAGYYEQALAINPERATSHTGLARAQAARRAWSAAARELETSLRLDPFDTKARELLVRCYLQIGQHDRARREFTRLLAFDPPQREALRNWFERQARDQVPRSGQRP